MPSQLSHGIEVTVFDKSRSTEGRLASIKNDDNAFDFGAQYFTARDVRFEKFLSRLVLLGTASAWQGKFVRASKGCLT
ncbi:MAG: NAD(P)-binding protein [Candidatus Obscuribacterales bacterium]|nr:NAD(P)-binding protein [Candidatus Obscuribacterales bacterium]